MRTVPVLLLFQIFCLTSCYRNKVDEEKYNWKYEVGQIPDLKSFLDYSNDGDTSDISYPEVDGFNPMFEPFIFKYANNRIRFDDSVYKNGILAYIDTGHTGFCHCIFAADTMLIQGRIRAGEFDLKIRGDSFQFIPIMMEDGNYKYDFTDSLLAWPLYVKSQYQFLQLDKKPQLVNDEQITGYLTYTSTKYYQEGRRDWTKLDTCYHKGKLYFTCQTKKNVRGIPRIHFIYF